MSGPVVYQARQFAEAIQRAQGGHIQEVREQLAPPISCLTR